MNGNIHSIETFGTVDGPGFDMLFLHKGVCYVVNFVIMQIHGKSDQANKCL